LLALVVTNLLLGAIAEGIPDSLDAIRESFGHARNNAHLPEIIAGFVVGRADLPGLGRRGCEMAAIVAVYTLFLLIGLYTQTASSFDAVRVDIVSPLDGMQFRSSPVELAVIVTNRAGPLSNVSSTITVRSLTSGDTMELAGASNEDGIVKLLFPAQSGNYTWYVSTKMEGYPTMVSRPRNFSAKLTMIVDCLSPCSSRNPLLLHSRYADLIVMVTDKNGDPVESANVTFYVNSMIIRSELTDPRGLATISWSGIPPGNYFWFAIASKGDEVGASRLSSFEVE
jgi:hypothetical protein